MVPIFQSWEPGKMESSPISWVPARGGEDENFNNLQALFWDNFHAIKELFAEVAGSKTDCVIRPGRWGMELIR